MRKMTAKMPVQKGKLKPDQPDLQEMSFKEKASADKKGVKVRESGMNLKKVSPKKKK